MLEGILHPNGIGYHEMEDYTVKLILGKPNTLYNMGPTIFMAVYSHMAGSDSKSDDLHLFTVMEATVTRLAPRASDLFGRNKIHTNQMRAATEEQLLLGGYIGIEPNAAEKEVICPLFTMMTQTS